MIIKLCQRLRRHGSFKWVLVKSQYGFCCRVKLAVEDIEAEEAALLEDLYAADRKFSEYYNVGDWTFSFGHLFLLVCSILVVETFLFFGGS